MVKTVELDAKTIFGVPIEEARKVLEIYRETGVAPSKDYAEGFEAGIDAAHEIIVEELNKTINKAREVRAE